MYSTRTAGIAAIAFLLCLGTLRASAQEHQQAPAGKATMDMEHEGHAMAPAREGEATISIGITPSSGLAVGKLTDFSVTLQTKEGKPVTFDDLKEAHTQKIHLLMVDPSLTDYHHVHPTATEKPGTFTFSIVPKSSGEYTVYADLVPTLTGEQEFARTQFTVAGTALPVTKTTNTETTVDGYNLSISFGNPELTVGEANVMTITITDASGNPFTNLEPIMGAYAHLVAFDEGRDHITHVHPMATGPAKDSDRGGPSLQFHLQFAEAGYHKLFAQFQIDGKNVIAAFGLNIKPSDHAGGAPADGSALATAHGHSDGMVEIPDTVEGILDEVAEHLGELDKVVASGKLEGVHELAFDIRDMLLALPEKAVALTSVNAKALSGSLNRIKQQAKLLDQFGDAGDAAQTQMVIGKYKAEIAAIRKLVGAKNSSVNEPARPSN